MAGRGAENAALAPVAAEGAQHRRHGAGHVVGAKCLHRLRRERPELVVGIASEITDQKRAEQHKELLADEMRHRARNLVAIVQAIGRMSRPKGQPEVNKYIDVFMGRLLTLLNTGGIVLSSTARTADLREILDAALKPFASSRISIQGPAVSLSEHTAGSMALAFHELATNAIKYGALSAERPAATSAAAH